MAKYRYEQLSPEERLGIIEQRLDAIDEGDQAVRGLEVQLQQAEVDAAISGQSAAVDSIKEQLQVHKDAAAERRARVDELIAQVKRERA